MADPYRPIRPDEAGPDDTRRPPLTDRSFCCAERPGSASRRPALRLPGTLRAGFTAAFIDLDHIGFRRPVAASDTGNHRLKARNLAALWQTYRAAGAQRLIVSGPVEGEAAVKAYAGALPRRPSRCAAATPDPIS